MASSGNQEVEAVVPLRSLAGRRARRYDITQNFAITSANVQAFFPPDVVFLGPG